MQILLSWKDYLSLSFFIEGFTGAKKTKQDSPI